MFPGREISICSQFPCRHYLVWWVSVKGLVCSAARVRIEIMVMVDAPNPIMAARCGD